MVRRPAGRAARWGAPELNGKLGWAACARKMRAAADAPAINAAPRPVLVTGGARKVLEPEGGVYTAASAPAAAFTSSRSSGRNVSHPWGSFPPRTTSKKASWSSAVMGPRRPAPMV